MSPLNRWKLISLVLAGCMSYTWWHGDARSEPKSAHARLKGPLRVSAAALGVSIDELVRQIFAARDADELRPLAEKLGVVGDDSAIDAVMPLLQDAREGVPETIIGAFGVIATDHAVDVLIKTVADPREAVHDAAVEALGATHHPKAEPTL
ncbi:MAG TPA: HEAT repeat domain-containing protein, partial [Kofleriaceae bacterium]